MLSIQDPLSIGLKDVVESRISGDELTSLRFRSTATSDIRDVASLKRRILEHLHLYALNNVPLRLETINRQFARAARRLGTNVRELVMDLHSSGLVVWFESPKTKAMFSASVWNDMKALALEHGMDPLDVRDNILKNTE